MEYLFTLKFALGRTESSIDEIVERLGAAGCTDSVLGLGTPGHLGIEFSREASGAREAMTSAITDVLRAIPTAELIDASPDYLGLLSDRKAG